MFPNATHDHMTDEEIWQIFHHDYVHPLCRFLGAFHENTPGADFFDIICDEFAEIIEPDYLEDQKSSFVPVVVWFCKR